MLGLVLLAGSACGTVERCDAGCSAPDAGLAPDAGTPDAGSATPVQFCADFAEAQFAFEVRCGALTSAGAADLLAIEVKRCAGDVAPGLAAGRVRFDAATARTCVASLAAVSCSRPSELYAACAAVFSGAVALDGDCFDSSECQGSLSCELGATCPGRCKPRIALGQPATGDCVAGGYVYAGTCSPFIARGQSCSAVAPSTELRQCEPGSRCDDRHVCVSSDLQAVHQACSAGVLDCAEGLQCVSDLCVPLADVGAPCDASVSCRTDLLCGAAHVCAARGDVGAACASENECRPNLFCALPNGGGAGVCAADRAIGQRCTVDGNECASGLFCTTAGLCQAPGSAGAACTATGPALQCRPGLSCLASICTLQRFTGASCTAGEQCQSGLCTTGACAPGVCLAP